MPNSGRIKIVPIQSALVTGAGGLLGRATVNRLVDLGVEVHAVVRDRAQAHRDDVVFHEIDLSRPMTTQELPQRVDAVFHLAQAREFRDFPAAAPQVFAINVATTAFLLDWAQRRNASAFVYASSGGVYAGSADPLSEEAPLRAPHELGYYLTTKLSSEALVGSYAEQFTAVSLRYFFIYGPGQDRSMLIPRLYDRVRTGEALALQGADGMAINPVHVTDAALATVAALNLTGRATVNVAGPQRLSLREIGELFGRDSGKEPAFELSGGEATDLIASVDLMSEKLVAPRRTLAGSLNDIR
jgi:nucleoside-diphosphate-sugar epimerase